MRSAELVRLFSSSWQVFVLDNLLYSGTLDGATSIYTTDLSWSPLLQFIMQYLFLHLPISLFLPFIATQVSKVLADVTWDSPSVGDVYIPGDTLQAIW